MIKSLRAIYWILLIICIMAIQSCDREISYYDITVTNDTYVFADCKIYLDGIFQFIVDSKESNTIEQVKEGKHTITVKAIGGDIIARQTFDLSQNQQWFISEHYDWSWVSSGYIK